MLTFEAAKGGFGFLGVESSALDSPAYFLLAPDSPEAKPLLARFSELRKRRRVSRQIKEIRAFLLDWLSASVRATLFEANGAAKTGSVLTTSSRADAMTLRILDKAPGDFRLTARWEDLRALELPWLSQLSVEDVLRVREQARAALPRFRARMAQELDGLDPKAKDGDEQARQIVGRLKAEVEDLAAELREVKASGPGRLVEWALAAGGLGCIVYGIGAHDSTALQIGGSLVAGLAAVHPAQREREAKHEELSSRPPYLLLKAKELIPKH